MEVIEVRGKTQPFDRALDVFGDVCAGVGHPAVSENIEAALGRDWT